NSGGNTAAAVGSGLAVGRVDRMVVAAWSTTDHADSAAGTEPLSRRSLQPAILRSPCRASMVGALYTRPTRKRPDAAPVWQRGVVLLSHRPEARTYALGTCPRRARSTVRQLRLPPRR